LLLLLRDHLGGEAKVRKGNVWYEPDCPFCGKGKRHFGYTAGFCEGGRFKCFHCNRDGSLYALAKERGILPGPDYAPKQLARPSMEAPQQPAAPPEWLPYAEKLVSGYTAHPKRFDLWQAYKPLSRETIERWELGVGYLPKPFDYATWLTFPVRNTAGQIIALRGRAIRPDQKPKWATMTGSETTLFNLPSAGRGRIAWVIENMVDALMVMQQHRDYDAFAPTTGVSTWRSEWTQALAAAKYELVVVAYDNDLPGQPSPSIRQRLLDAWQAEHPGMKPPDANGPKVANELLRAGVNVVLYEWPGFAPAKADIGWLLSQGRAAA
jgi:hypothetical protein